MHQSYNWHVRKRGVQAHSSANANCGASKSAVGTILLRVCLLTDVASRLLLLLHHGWDVSAASKGVAETCFESCSGGKLVKAACCARLGCACSPPWASKQTAVQALIHVSSLGVVAQVIYQVTLLLLLN